MGQRKLKMKYNLMIAACLLFGACSKEDHVAPTIRYISINGSTDHGSLEAGIENEIGILIQDENVRQVSCTVQREGPDANHDHGSATNFYGMVIPNHGYFMFNGFRNLDGELDEAVFNFEIPAANSGLWKIQVEALDRAGNYTRVEEYVAINSMAFPFVSLTGLSSALTIGEGTLTAPVLTNWDWQGDIYDLDSLDYVRMTIQRNGDTLQSYINEEPNAWTLDVSNIPVTMPAEPGQYQFRLEVGDINGNQTWRTSTLIAE
jgi:hypothetical protein